MNHPDPTKAETGLTAANLAARRGKITASAYPRIKAGGGNARTELIRIARERLNLPSLRRQMNKAMAHGHETEPQAAAIIARDYEMIRWTALDNCRDLPANIKNQHIHKSLQGVDIRHNEDFMDGAHASLKAGCTPDMIISGALLGMVEIKTPYSRGRFAECAKAPDPQHVEQVWFADFVLRALMDGDINPTHRLLIYSKSAPESVDDLAPHLIYASPAEREKIHAEIKETLAEAERQIAEITSQLMAQEGLFPANPDERLPADVAEIATAKAALDAIDKRRKELKQAIDTAARKAGERHMQTLAKEIDVVERALGAKISPPGIRRATQPGEIVIKDLGAVPTEYLKLSPDITAIRAALNAGAQLPGVEQKPDRPTITVIKKANKTAESHAIQTFGRALGRIPVARAMATETLTCPHELDGSCQAPGGCKCRQGMPPELT